MPFFDRLRLIYFSYFDEILGGGSTGDSCSVVVGSFNIYYFYKLKNAAYFIILQSVRN